MQEAIQTTAMAGTSAGQAVQAMSLINRMTPQGQALWIEKSVEKLNNQLKEKRGKNAPQFELTPEMLQKVANSNESNLQENLDSVYKELELYPDI